MGLLPPAGCGILSLFFLHEKKKLIAANRMNRLFFMIFIFLLLVLISIQKKDERPVGAL
jgi:hypothetical protein